MFTPLVLMLVSSAASEAAGSRSAANSAGPLRPGPESSATQEPQRIRSRVDALLGTNGPINAARWRSLGPGAAPILEEIAGDNKALPTRRARALEGLVAIRAPNASKILVRPAQSHGAPLHARLDARRRGGAQVSASRPR